MKTVLINGSPKKRFSASSYFLVLQRICIHDTKISETLRGRGDYQRILDEITDADTVVFCMPLYVDSVPSHVLAFMKEMESFCLKNDIRLNIYCIANNGFIEGRQNEPLMRVFRNFCERSRLDWRGGIGIGGGVMLNVTRILFAVNAAIFLLNILCSGISGGSIFPAEAFKGFLTGVMVLLFLNMGVLYYIFRMGRAINTGGGSSRDREIIFGEKYTRILLPSFVFILFADIFFLVISIFAGGMFRGWLAKK